VRTVALALVALSPAVACGGSDAHPVPDPSAVQHPVTVTTGTADVAADQPAAAPPRIEFVQDDYAAALARAREAHVPLFVDTWAAWCHTCLSMREYVFPDASLQRFGPRFVWLAIDTERDASAPFLAKYPVKALPTLFVIDPASEQPVLAWAGSLTAAELAPLLEDAEGAVRSAGGGTGGTGGMGEASVALLRGNKAAADGKTGDAIEAYRAALAAAPADWPRRPEALDALVSKLADDKQLGPCVTTAADEAPKMPPGTALADVVRAGLGCASDLPKKAPERARLADLASLGARVAGDTAQPILADDRSDLYDYVVHAMRDLGRDDDAKKLAASWSAFLDDQAAHAATPAARAVFDAHRLLAYIAVGSPDRAVPMLDQSEHDFPGDYNPPARLAAAYLAMKKYDDAIAAAKRALDKAYGPRKLRIWSVEADVYEAKHDRASAKKALSDALDYAKTIPLAGGYPKLRDALAARLAKMR
jgi:tetratricopeptide (TPR) repeat protein